MVLQAQLHRPFQNCGKCLHCKLQYVTFRKRSGGGGGGRGGGGVERR